MVGICSVQCSWLVSVQCSVHCCRYLFSVQCSWLVLYYTIHFVVLFFLQVCNASRYSSIEFGHVQAVLYSAGTLCKPFSCCANYVLILHCACKVLSWNVQHYVMLILVQCTCSLHMRTHGVVKIGICSSIV